MSIDNSTLDDFVEESASTTESALDGRGAVYGGAPEQKTTQHRPLNAGCCTGCGEDVKDHSHTPSKVKRVFGDEHGRVPACPACKDAITYAQAINSAEPTTRMAREMGRVESHKREVADL